MIGDARLNQLIFAADHTGFCNDAAVKWFKGSGPQQITLSCEELKELLGAYLERRTTSYNEKSVQDCASTANEVSK